MINKSIKITTVAALTIFIRVHDTQVLENQRVTFEKNPCHKTKEEQGTIKSHSLVEQPHKRTAKNALYSFC